MDTKSIAGVVAEIAKSEIAGSRFVSLTYKAKGTGEVARFTVLLGASLEKIYRRDLSVLRKRLSRLPSTEALRLQALTELVNSYSDSVTNGIGNNAKYTKQGYYMQVFPGLKFAPETGNLYVSGFRIAKKVIQPGVYKSVNSKPLTIAKDEERKSLKMNKFREFVIAPETLQVFRANGREIEIVAV